MSGTLYTFPNNFRANKILIAAQYSGHNVTVSPDFVPGETEQSAEFVKKFPLKKVPAYESGDVLLAQTNAIAYYVGNEQTRGGEKEAEVLEWIGFADNVILPSACTWVYPTQGILQYNKQSTEKAKADLKAALETLNNFLATRTFLVGERVSQADISLACTMSMLFEHVMDAEFRKPYKNVTRWFTTLINQPQFKAVLGDVKLCEKMAVFDAQKYNEIHGKGGKKEKTPKGKKGGGQGDGKSPKPKKEQKKIEEDVDVPKPKQNKDPWGHLPATNFDMDAWKRMYSNHDWKEAEKYFWEHFDKENYSIWEATYMYSEDFRMSFMASNLVGGMYQRLEKMQKQSFGGMCVLSNEGKFHIRGVWFWKGQGLAFELSENWQVDYESYKWEKLDPDSEETRKKVDLFWSGAESIDGWKSDDMKVFK